MSPRIPALAWSAAFAAALLLGTALKLWLTTRQIRHVQAHRGAVPAPFAASIDLAAHRKAADYTIARARFGQLHTLYSALLVVVWTLLGGLQGLADTVGAHLGDGIGAQLALLGAFVLLSSLLDLPWDLWQTFRLEARFGFNRSTLALFAVDALRNLAVSACLLAPLAWLVLWLMRTSGLWWLWGWAAFAGFSLVMMVVFPTLIAPLFNRFEPLPDGEVRRRAQDLMRRCGFALQGLYVMDGSRRSAHANAYFTGIGSARRVVLFDTLLQQLDPVQVEAVLAHEVGHYKRHHVRQRLVLTLLASLAAFALLGWAATRNWFYTGLGCVPQPPQAVALLLSMLVLPVFGVFVTPLGAAWSRRHEFEADAYAAAHADAGALGAALVRMYRDNASTLTPDPLYANFYYSHPPAMQRLARLRALPGA